MSADDAVWFEAYNAPVKRFPVIDGLRGYCVLAVVYSHTYLRLLTPNGAYTFMLWGIPFFPVTFLSNSWMAVSLFFILSGFVLALPYAQGQRTMSSMQDLLTFYKRRALRLYPVYWAIMIPLMLINRTWESVGLFFHDAFFVLSGVGVLHPTLWKPWYYAIVWTLELEIAFSFLMPALLVCMRRYGYVIPLTYTILLGSMMHFYATLHTGHEPLHFWMHNIIGSLPDFSAGMAAAFFISQNSPIKRRSLLTAVGIVAVYFSFEVKDITWTTSLTNPNFLATSETFFTVGATLLLLIIVTSKKRWIQLVFANRPIRWAGIMCYSFYLHHYWLIKRIRPVEDLWRLALYVVVLIGVTLLTFKFIEFPRKRWRELIPQKVTV